MSDLNTRMEDVDLLEFDRGNPRLWLDLIQTPKDIEKRSRVLVRPKGIWVINRVTQEFEIVALNKES